MTDPNILRIPENRGGLAPSSKGSLPVIDGLRYSVGFLILATYLVPSTLFAKPGEALALELLNDTPSTLAISALSWFILACAVAPVLILCSTKSRLQFMAAILAAMYLSGFCITIGSGGWYEQSDNCRQVLLEISFGLIATWLIGSLTKLWHLLCALGAIQSIYGICNWASGKGIFYSGFVERFSGTTQSPGTIYIILAVSFIVSVRLLYEAKGTRLQLLWSAITLLQGTTLLLTFQRGGIIACGISLLWFCFRSGIKRRNLLLLLLAVCLISALASVTRMYGRVNLASSDRSITGRSDLWREGASIFWSHPISGVGDGALQIYLGSMKRHSKDGLLPEPKNLLLFLLDELGITGGLMYGLLVLYVAKISSFAVDADIRLIASCWIFVMISGIVDTPFGVQTMVCGNIVFGVLVGTAALVHLRKDRNSTSANYDNR